MCIGHPLRIVEMHEFLAVCEAPSGAREHVDMSLLGPREPGTWVLVFLGHARSVLEAEEALRIHDALGALDAVMRGEAVDVERCFADLLEREPQLPEHLRPPCSPDPSFLRGPRTMSHALIDRLSDELGYPRVSAQNLDSVLQLAENTVLFFSGDPATVPEASDVAVVLPELVRHFDGRLGAGIVERADERALQALYGFEIWPALVFLRGQQYLGAISRIRDWSDYLQRIQEFLDTGPVRTPAPRIPILPA